MITITPRPRHHNWLSGLAVTLALALVAACGSSSPSPAKSGGNDTSPPATEGAVDKAGNTNADSAVTLTLGWYGAQGRPQAQVAERFAEEVAKSSNGKITIDIVYEVGDSWKKFQGGEFDMLLTPARSLDTMGVQTFDSLTLPLLVTDDDQADRVARSPIVDTMMAGLEGINATGLMLDPVYQMHLAITGTDPLRTLDQLHTGLRIAPPSNLLDKIYQEIGVTPAYDLNGDVWGHAVEDGKVLAMEFPLSLALNAPAPMQMAANYAMYYEFVVLIASNESLARLSSEQLDVVRAAAETAQERSITERVREPDAFRNACAEGAILTAAPMTFIADVGRAVDDLVLTTLEDAATKHIYDEVRRAAGARSAAWPSECKDGEVTRYEPPAPPSATFPAGTYRVRGRSREQLLVSGVTNDSATGNYSDYIDFTVQDNKVSFEFHYPAGNSGPVAKPCSTDYTVDGDGRIAILGCGFEGTYTWHDTSEGIALELTPTDNSTALLYEWDNSAIGLSALVGVN